jgi:nucleoid DNA-binding protein
MSQSVIEKPAVKKNKALSVRLTKTEQIARIAENCDLTKQQVKAVLNEIEDMMEAHLKPRSCGEFLFAGLFKIVKIAKPATRARKGINPFTKEEVVFKAKPASKQIKIRPLAKLKGMTG